MGGTAGQPGSAGANASAAAGGRGGLAGEGGAAGSAGDAGQIGSAGASGGGAGGSSAGHGSTAKFVCAPHASYGDPLAGMGAVTTISAQAPDHFVFTEGTIWIAGLSTLFFSDNASTPSERIFKLVPPSTTPALFVANSGSNGLAVDNRDFLIAADQRNKRIVRFEPMTGQMVGTPIPTGAAKPNDLIVRSDENIYFTDPDSGFYRISPSGTVSAAMKLTASNRPNGIELSLDEGTLYVGDVGNRTIAKYPLASDGSVNTAAGVNLVTQTMHDFVDGMCIDCAGNIYAGTSGGIEVYSSDGKYLGIVLTGSSSNCTFGDADRKTLYVASRTVLKSVRVSVPGLPD
jgi:gluconolactonase